MSETSLRALIGYQQVLSELGFSINAADGSYYKDYGLLNGGYARLVPVFDKGTAFDQTYQIVALSILNSVVVPVENGATQLDKLPMECMRDVTHLLATCSPQSRAPAKESFIIEEVCDKCKTKVSSFFKARGSILCTTCL